MSKRYPFTNDLASIIKAVLLIVLGGKCVKCGATLLSVLEIDHPNGRNWSPRKLSRIKRVLRYCEEYRRGVPLRVLCRRCNAIKPVQLIINLPLPDNHLEEFDQVIQMLEMSKGNEVTLDGNEFRAYLCNKWGWQRNFLASNSRYSESAMFAMNSGDVD